ncbi:RIP metalloprotease RseP [Winogradskyella litoriviva]|uniref:Zinc metalloprotease n=1 Tax=Winogradskyella litoriviva TaxID=1220182 RepID=A0ABX2E189_9FLAO|nr:RIP metalloprotease RseP [Winogradskyella litoriviva]NRD22045.1 RIP metalloprotease RseP [Winogradskyella litoriviva]
MEFIIKISQFLLSLSLLIVLHELGHFIPAKLFKTKVEKFYLFFDVKFSLFKKKIGETVYGIGWLPLGGYVKIAGMIDESMDKEAMAKPPQPWEFRSKPAWQRLIIMLGGVTVNFILAYFIYVALSFVYGDTDVTTDSMKDGYWIENKLLLDVGFKTGDKIVAINDQKVSTYSEVRKNLVKGEKYSIVRDGKTKEIVLPEDFLGQLSSAERENGTFRLRIPFMVGDVPDTSLNKSVDIKTGDILLSLNGQNIRYFDQVADKLLQYKDQSVKATFLRGDEKIDRTLEVSDDAKFEVGLATHNSRFAELGYFDIIHKDYTFLESFGGGVDKFKEQVTDYFGQLGKIFTPSTGAYKGVGGFKAIFDVFPDQWIWQDFWGLTAFLSIMLAILNLLPIPALDGGHVMFLLYEMISGRKPSEKFLERAQMVGFFILIALVLFANGNDIFKAITK